MTRFADTVIPSAVTVTPPEPVAIDRTGAL